MSGYDRYGTPLVPPLEDRWFEAFFIPWAWAWGSPAGAVSLYQGGTFYRLPPFVRRLVESEPLS